MTLTSETRAPVGARANSGETVTAGRLRGADPLNDENRGGASERPQTLVSNRQMNSGLESCTPNCCTSFQTTTAQYRSSLSETSSRKQSGIPKTLSTRSLAPVSERSTIRHESAFPYRGTILAGLPSLYRTERRCSTILRLSTLRLQSGLSVEVVIAELMRAALGFFRLLPANESQNEGAAV